MLQAAPIFLETGQKDRMSCTCCKLVGDTLVSSRLWEEFQKPHVTLLFSHRDPACAQTSHVWHRVWMWFFTHSCLGSILVYFTLSFFVSPKVCPSDLHKSGFVQVLEPHCNWNKDCLVCFQIQKYSTDPSKGKLW